MYQQQTKLRPYVVEAEDVLNRSALSLDSVETGPGRGDFSISLYTATT